MPSGVSVRVAPPAHETGKRIPEMTKEELELGLKRANIIGALTTTKKGAIDACPNTEDLKQYA